MPSLKLDPPSASNNDGAEISHRGETYTYGLPSATINGQPPPSTPPPPPQSDEQRRAINAQLGASAVRARAQLLADAEDNAPNNNTKPATGIMKQNATTTCPSMLPYRDPSSSARFSLVLCRHRIPFPLAALVLAAVVWTLMTGGSSDCQSSNGASAGWVLFPQENWPMLPGKLRPPRAARRDSLSPSLAAAQEAK